MPILTSSIKPLHRLLDLAPTALLHTKRMQKVTAKLEKEHRALQDKLANERRRQREADEERKREEALEKLKREYPEQYHQYVMQQAGLGGLARLAHAQNGSALQQAALAQQLQNARRVSVNSLNDIYL